MATLTGAHFLDNAAATGGSPSDTPSFSSAALVGSAAAQTLTPAPLETVAGGVGDTVIGAVGDTIFGAADESIVGAAGDTITMGASDTVVAAAGDTVIGGTGAGSDTLMAYGGHETVEGSPADESVAGFDTVSGPGHDAIDFAGQSQSSIQKVVATQEQTGGNVTLHLPDGSSMTLIGVSHVDSGFFH
jgi:hypothetical protein